MTDATDDARKWAWIAPDGTDGSGPGPELLRLLRSGALPPTTLVWCATWLEWLPASRVGYLAKSLPKGTAEKAQEPKRAATALSPPPRPAGVPPALPRPAIAARPPAGASAEPPGDKPSSFGVLGRPRGASILGPRGAPTASNLPREPLPTLADDPSDTRATLRPPGAVPPPPRGGPVGFARPPQREPDETVRRPALGLGGAGPNRDTLPEITERAPAPTTLDGSDVRPAVILPGAPKSVAIQSVSPAAAATQPAPKGYPAAAAAPKQTPPSSAGIDVALSSTPYSEGAAIEAAPPSTTLESAAPLPPPSSEHTTSPVSASELTTSPVSASELTSERLSRPPVPRIALLGLALLAIVVVILAAGLVALVVVRLRESPSTAQAPTSSAVASTAPPVAPGCEILAPAARLAASVHRAVPPLLADLGTGDRVAVGFAEGPKQALGLLVDLGTLDQSRAFEQAGEEALFGVVPLATKGAATFSVDRARGLGGARTIAQNVTVGVMGVDLVRVSGGTMTVLWPKAATDKITDPRVAAGAGGHLVTFRRGGLSGKVLYGFLDADGKARGELVALEAPDLGMAGTPDVAASRTGGLIAFAGRPNADAPWRVHLALVSPSAKPTVVAFQSPPGGAGGGSIAPSVSPLGDSEWLLQWTEGATGQYQVRVQRLGTNLEPVGEAKQASPKGANAGQGTLLAVGSKVLSVFVQTTAGHDELWGASLQCN